MELIYKLNQWYLLNKADNLISLDPRYETSRQADLQYVWTDQRLITVFTSNTSATGKASFPTHKSQADFSAAMKHFPTSYTRRSSGPAIDVPDLSPPQELSCFSRP